MGGPIWWNTPITEDVEKKATKKRKSAEAAEADEAPDVAKRIAALKREMTGGGAAAEAHDGLD